MLFSKMEGFLEKHIEGFFNRKFSSDLQFTEIEKNLEHLLNRKRKKINNQFFIPNIYLIKMANSDYERLCSNRSKILLKEFLIKTAIYNNWFIKGEVKIDFFNDDNLKKGMCNIEDQFNTDIKVDKNQISQNTIIVQNTNDSILTAKEKEYVYASLRVIEGKDMNTSCLLGEKRVHLGRREENEFLLTDLNVSRLHAYISFEQGRHIIYDANSLNGTFVNQKRIEKSILCDKDVVSIGQSKILYEVLL